MLRYQLNPHFLFNTLNAISTLILDKDTQLANSMVMKLSRFLRYSLDNDPMQQVTVAEELESLQLYLDIEKVRFGDRLTLHFNVTPDAQDALMPSLLLQPLVENSIKYAVSQSISGGSIAVSAAVSDGCLQLSVADDGPGLDLRHGRLPKGGGVGLANTRERLSQVYGDRQIVPPQHYRTPRPDDHHLPARDLRCQGGRMKALSAIIVDDEQLARRGLSVRLQQLPEVDVIAECATGRRHSTPSPSTRRTSCSWISRCPAWTASRWSKSCRAMTCRW
jgi:anti-sigma regulatory factor (Ser/Thr protein kinase)